MCITASGSKSHQLLAAWRKGGNHQTSHKMRARPHYFRVLSQDEGAHPLLWGRAPIIMGALHNQQALIHFPNLPPSYLPATSADPPLHPYTWVRGGPRTPPPPFDLKSSIETSWPRDGLLTTSQAPQTIQTHRRRAHLRLIKPILEKLGCPMCLCLRG